MAACRPRYADIMIAKILIVSTNIVTNGVVIVGSGAVKNKIKVLTPKKANNIKMELKTTKNFLLLKKLIDFISSIY
jgi:hypothetical protein